MNTTSKTISAGEVSKRTIYEDPALVKRKPGFNPRFDFGEIKELMDSMRATGFHPHKPLLVKRVDGAFELVDGDRRLTAVEKLLQEGFTFPDGIPLAIADKNLTETDLLVMAYTANGGKPFLPLEEAAAFKRMVDGGLSKKEVCERTGRSHMHVHQALALINADDSVKEAVAKGEISATLGKTIAAKNKGNAAKQKELVTKAKGSKSGKKVVEEETRRTLRRPQSSKQPIKPLGKAQLEELQAKYTGKFNRMLKSLGYDSLEAFRVEVSKDDSLALAFQMGIMIALEGSLGAKVKWEA